MNNSKRIICRILLLASIAILMILLCGCRTRLSNNSDVHARIEDESGYLSENYEYRREDLDLSIAEKPLINPDNGEDDEEDYDDYADDFDYEPSDTDTYEEEDTTTEDDDSDSSDDDDKSTTTSSTTTTRPSSGTTRRSSTGVRRSSTTTTTTAVKVTLNANGGECKKTSIYVRKGSTYGTLPEAERDGYKFLGWYTKKKDGNKVTSKTKVNTSSAHTLYAHWEVQTKKTYKVSFDGNSGGDEVTMDFDSITVEEDGKYGELPKPRRVGCKFEGWFTEKEEGKGTEVTKGDKFTANKDQTLYAHWNDDHYSWWDDEFKEAANEVADPMPYFLIRDHPDYDYGTTDYKQVKKLLDDCKGSEETDQKYADISVLLIPEPAEGEGTFEEIAEAAVVAYLNMQEHADYSGRVIVISRDAIKNNSNENLVARLKMLYELYGKDLDAAKAAEQLGVDKTLIYVFPAA